MEEAERIKATSLASSSNQGREEAIASRFRTTVGRKTDWKAVGGFEMIACLLNRHPTLPEEASLITRIVEESMKGATRRKVFGYKRE